MAAKKISFIKVPWSQEASVLLAGAMSDHATYTVEELRAEVMAGKASLMSVIADAQIRLGYVVFWFETVGGRELVVQAGEAFSDTLRTMPDVMPSIYEYARLNDAVSIRCHVPVGFRGSAARVRALKKAGMVLAEYVMRKDV